VANQSDWPPPRASFSALVRPSWAVCNQVNFETFNMIGLWAMTGPTIRGETMERSVVSLLDQNDELTRRIDTLTFRQIGSLQVECSGTCVSLGGCCKTYYVKQLATQAVLDLLPGANIINLIDVMQ
jgi:hypothetical protein